MLVLADEATIATTRLLPRRRLQQVQQLCDGGVYSTNLQTTFFNVELHSRLFDGSATLGLWGSKPLLGSPHPGVLRLRCSSNDLSTLRDSYTGLAMEPLMRAIRQHNGRRPFAPVADGTALLVLPDYANFYHQFGSLVTAWAAYQESLHTARPPASLASSSQNEAGERVTVFMLNNATLAPTAEFWSHGLDGRGRVSAPVFVRSSPPPPPATYRRVVCVQPATETWWWTVWAADNTDRRSVIGPLIRRLTSSLLDGPHPVAAAARATAQAAIGVPSAGVAALATARGSPAIALIVRRPASTDRKILNEEELASALAPVLALASPPLAVRLVDLSRLSTRAQLAVVRQSALLIGAHGAGLLWNLFLPDGAPVVELLNLAGANEYYANHCRWMRRPYALWQNNDSAAEEHAHDPLTRAPLDAFRNHMRVDVPAVVSVVRGLLASVPLQARGKTF